MALFLSTGPQLLAKISLNFSHIVCFAVSETFHMFPLNLTLHLRAQ